MKMPTTKILPNLQGGLDNVEYGKFQTITLKNVTLHSSVSIGILIVIFRIQIYLKPYKNSKNNEIEMKAILIGALSLFCGTIFITKGANVDTINTFIFVVLIVSNVYFIINWVLFFLLSLNSKSKYIGIVIFILSVIMCSREYSKNNLNDTTEVSPSTIKTKKHKKCKRIKVSYVFANCFPSIRIT